MAVRDVITSPDATSATWASLRLEHTGRRVIVVLGDRASGASATVTTDQPELPSLTQVLQHIPSSGGSKTIHVFEAIIPTFTANPIITSTVLNGSETSVAHARVAFVVDEAGTYTLADVASSDSGASAVTSWLTGETAIVPAGDLLIVAAGTTRGTTTIAWSVTDHEPANPGGGTWLLQVEQGGNAANARTAFAGYASLTGQSAQTWEDTLTLGTARETSLGILVWSTDDGGGTNATPTPAVIATTAAPPQPAVNVQAGPVAIPMTATVPTPTISTAGNATPTPAIIEAVAALAQPAVDITAGPAAIPLAVAMPEWAINVTAGPDVIPVTVTVPTPTVSTAGNATPTPAVIQAVAALTRPEVGVASGPETVPLTAALPQPAINVGAGPSTIPVTVTLPQATPQAGGNVTAQPAIIATTVTLPQAATATDFAVTPATIEATVNLPRAAVNVGLTPAIIPVTVALPAASTPIGATGSPAAVAATVTIPAAGVNTAVSPDTIAVMVAFHLPDVGATVAASASSTVAALVAASAAVAAATTSTSTVSEG